MKPNPNLDELLSSFMDGELSPRQRTEVQRLATHDPQVARRLQQLQNCRTLYTALPVAKAPSDLMEQIKASLERHSLLQQQPASAGRALGVWQLAFRRVVSAAAVLALMGALGWVIYEIVAPVPPGGSRMMANGQGPVGTEPVRAVPPVVLVADAGFTGRLELRTARLTQTDAFLGRAIENCGLASRLEPSIVGDQRVYRIAGTRENVNRLVASLSGVWPSFDSVALQVDRPEDATAPVVIEAVTPEQMAAVVAQNNTRASIDTAAHFAIMNDFAKAMPGTDLRPALQNDPGLLFALSNPPQPRETGPDNTARPTPAPTPEGAQVTLTIVLLGTR
jgi:hypothetical protein